MRKRIISGLLSLVMAVSLFAGCGGKTEESTEKEAKSEVTNTVEPTKAAADLGIWADYKIDRTNNLSNPNASEKAIVVYNWLKSIQGKYIISGLQEQCSDTQNKEFLYIKNLIDDLPGLRGLDFINGDYEGVVRRSKTWDKMNCMISICWHMGLPGEVDAGYNSSQKTYADLAAALDDPNSEGYKQILADIDKAAEYLKQLQDENIVVLWRPFHEFDGAWFWWGKAGSEAFVKLWRLMYDRYTNHFGLNNLIWVLGYSGKYASGHEKWYPGDEYVDIIGVDTYSSSNASNGYKTLYDCITHSFEGTDKPYTLHECGKVPNTGAMIQDSIEWLWFLVWHTGYIGDEAETSDSDILLNFTSEYMLTLGEMPDFDALIEAQPA